jgi:hypothetical protein
VAEDFLARGYRARALLGGVDAWKEEMQREKSGMKG